MLLLRFNGEKWRGSFRLCAFVQGKREKEVKLLHINWYIELLMNDFYSSINVRYLGRKVLVFRYFKMTLPIHYLTNYNTIFLVLWSPSAIKLSNKWTNKFRKTFSHNKTIWILNILHFHAHLIISFKYFHKLYTSSQLKHPLRLAKQAKQKKKRN